jgi:hypothetical protein
MRIRSSIGIGKSMISICNASRKARLRQIQRNNSGRCSVSASKSTSPRSPNSTSTRSPTSTSTRSPSSKDKSKH